MTDLDSVKILRQQNIHPSKRLGQNFIINNRICKQIVTKLDLNNVDAILEIGPGLGALTQELLTLNISIIAIEIDKRLSAILKKQIHHQHFSLVVDHALKVNWDNLLNKYKNPIIVANLPYVISSPTILKILSTPKINEAYLMLQKEMADRISAKVGTHAYNAFTVLIQRLASVSKLIEVNRVNFYPQPTVDSVVVKLSKNKNKSDNNYVIFLKKAFAAKRQTLFNNLKHWYDKNQINMILEQLGLDPKIRAEAINPDNLYKIYDYLNYYGNK